MYDICDTSLEERESESILNSIRVHSEEIEFDVNIAQSTHKFSCSQILLDTCAGESVFRDSELFHSIVPSTNSLIVNGVNKDSHPLIISESGETDFGMVYYNKDCVANILSFGKVVVSYDDKLNPTLGCADTHKLTQPFSVYEEKQFEPLKNRDNSSTLSSSEHIMIKKNKYLHRVKNGYI